MENVYKSLDSRFDKYIKEFSNLTTTQDCDGNFNIKKMQIDLNFFKSNIETLKQRKRYKDANRYLSQYQYMYNMYKDYTKYCRGVFFSSLEHQAKNMNDNFYDIENDIRRLYYDFNTLFNDIENYQSKDFCEHGFITIIKILDEIIEKYREKFYELSDYVEDFEKFLHFDGEILNKRQTKDLKNYWIYSSKKYYFELLNKMIKKFNFVINLCEKRDININIEEKIIERNIYDVDENVKNDIINLIDKHILTAELSKSEIKYDAKDYVTIRNVQKILDKYENKCYILDIEESKQYTSLGSSKFQYDYKKDEELEELAQRIKEKITSCIKNEIKVIAIPIGIPGHANALIYKIQSNTFEYFEPHGINSSILAQNKIDTFVKKLMELLVKNDTIPENPEYKSSEQTCPVINNRVSGLQRFENESNTDSVLNKYNFKLTTSVGFCQLWSLFYLELALRHPEIETSILVQIAHDYLKGYTEGDLGFTLFILGYYLELSKIKNPVCFNVETKEYDDILRFLNESEDNIILAYTNTDEIDEIYCDKRENFISEYGENISLENLNEVKNKKYRFFKVAKSSKSSGDAIAKGAKLPGTFGAKSSGDELYEIIAYMKEEYEAL
jgi:hypothetical protein